MDETALRVLWAAPLALQDRAAFERLDARVDITACEAAEVAWRVADAAFDVLVAPGDAGGAAAAAAVMPGAGAAAWAACTDAIAVVLLHGPVAPAARSRWIAAGVQDTMTPAELHSPEGAYRLRAAAQRHRLRLAERQAYATDVTTGLPHEGQLIEHMSHLLALREREPAPMALLVLRIEGFATTAARLGADSAGALRRKVAVRLRAGVRASDVVASLGEDSFAVLLSSIDAPGDAETVGRKLLAALSQTFTLAGTDVALATALGIAASVGDGAQPAALLQRAVALAASAQAVGRGGHANRLESGAGPAAANDG